MKKECQSTTVEEHINVYHERTPVSRRCPPDSGSQAKRRPRASDSWNTNHQNNKLYNNYTYKKSTAYTMSIIINIILL